MLYNVRKTVTLTLNLISYHSLAKSMSWQSQCEVKGCTCDDIFETDEKYNLHLITYHGITFHARNSKFDPWIQLPKKKTQRSLN